MTTPLEKIRITNPAMEFYRHVYRHSKKWDGVLSLSGKKVLIYCEQGYGDIIQFLRYIKPLKEQHGCEVTLHIPTSLHPLMPYLEGVDHFLDKQCSILPKHDFHILSLSLPFLLREEDVSCKAYLFCDKITDLEEKKDDFNIGIAWEGSPQHPKNFDRCCPLKHFGKLLSPGVNLFMLQNKIHDEQFTEGVDFDIYGVPIENFEDTAALINAVDIVVTVDTSVLHLAGAMGKKTFAVLGANPDPRWDVKEWYESVVLMKNKSWEECMLMINKLYILHE